MRNTKKATEFVHNDLPALSHWQEKNEVDTASERGEKNCLNVGGKKKHRLKLIMYAGFNEVLFNLFQFFEICKKS